MFKTYLVELAMITDVLGATSKNPSIYKTFLIDKQNELIKLYSNKASKNPDIFKYSGAKTFDGKDELEAIFRQIEKEIQRRLADDEKEKLLSEDAKDFMLELLGETTDLSSQVFLKCKEGYPYLGTQVVKGFLKSSSEAISRTRTGKNGTFNRSAAASSKYINQYLIASPIYFFDAKNDKKRKDIKRDDDGNAVYLERPLRAETAKGSRIALASSEIIESPCVAKFTISIFGDELNPLTINDLKDNFAYGVMVGFSAWRGSGQYGRFEVIDINEIKSKEEASELDLKGIPNLK